MDVLIDGDVIATEPQFHTLLREASGVAWYGGNLDALFDLLVAAAPAPIALRWINATRSRRAIGARFDRLLTVILDAIEARGEGAITFCLEA
jgi:RNAse (barnase) inhibitor barstar